MSEDQFDYGKKKEDGQYERYPTNANDNRIRPYRTEYKHTVCDGITKMSAGIAETYASNPHYYTHTFCARCKSHYPVAEFNWLDGKVVGS